MENLKKSLGGRIKEVRKKAGLTQKGLGLLLGVGISSISAYESGDSQVPPESIIKISETGKVSTDWLLTGTNTGPKEPTKEEALRLVITSDPALVESIKEDLRHQIREEAAGYKPGLSDQDQRLIEAYHCASEEIREAALGMLVQSAERSKGSGCGAGGLKQSN